MKAASSVLLSLSLFAATASAFGPARMTFYDVGLGACGWTNGPNDYIVAVNSAQFGGYAVYPPAICGKSITISYNGKQVGAVVADECPTCGYGELDLSRGLFNNFATEGDGVFYAEWWFNDGSSNPPPQTQAPPPPQTTEQPPPPQTTTEQPHNDPQTQPQPQTTTTKEAPPPPPPSSSSSQQQQPSSSAARPTSTSASQSDDVSTNDANSTPAPEPSNTPAPESNNLMDMGTAVVQLGRLIAQAGGRDLTVNKS